MSGCLRYHMSFWRSYCCYCVWSIYMYKLYFYVYQRNQVCWSRGPKEQDWGNTAVVTDRLGAKYKSFSMMGMFPVALKTYEANKNNLCKVVFLVQYISTFLEIIKCATIMLHVACVWHFHLPFCYQSMFASLFVSSEFLQHSWGLSFVCDQRSGTSNCICGVRAIIEPVGGRSRQEV